MEQRAKGKSFKDLIDSENLVLVDFFTEWCGPCKMMKPILEEVKSSLGDKVRVLKVDVERNARAAAQYQVTGVPTLILFKQGKPVWRESGVVPTGPLRAIIERNL